MSRYWIGLRADSPKQVVYIQGNCNLQVRSEAGLGRVVELGKDQFNRMMDVINKTEVPGHGSIRKFAYVAPWEPGMGRRECPMTLGEGDELIRKAEAKAEVMRRAQEQRETKEEKPVPVARERAEEEGKEEGSLDPSTFIIPEKPVADPAKEETKKIERPKSKRKRRSTGGRKK